MNINRHNYEEYFILYMDNELDAGHRRQVEEFVQKHPDLKEELDILLQYKLTPDDGVVFEGKEELLKHRATSRINMDNYEEWLTLYVDNELSDEQKNAVEQFIDANPSTRKELDVLSKTKLQPEKIVFRDKETLYRRAEKVKVVSMRWMRVAVAAVLILAAGTTAIVTLNKKSSKNNELANQSNKIGKQPPIVNSDEKKEIKAPAIPDAVQQIEPLIAKQNEKRAIRHENNEKKVQKDSPIKEVEQQVVVKEEQKPGNNLPQPLYNPNLPKLEKDKEDAVATNEKQDKNKAAGGDGVTTLPIAASYNEIINQPTEKKGKLRGFLRKATRIFEKTTNINPADDENRVLIGGLALKLN